MTRTFAFTSIGRVRSRFKRPEDIPPPAFAPPGFFDRSRGELRIYKKYEPALKDTEGFSHLVVIFSFHKSRGVKLQAVPPGETELRGIFATRSPHRPNPLGLTVVRVLGRRGAVLRVSGLDLVDGTPILDIKPLTGRDRPGRIRTGWIKK
ncbi:MAG: tRNA (N6-threonylcarbamoyladenosine(37)-N6)-methyltransferase TrmO [Candidatus Aminicenantes bacterium]|nr:tRNA (N6-threonylcarbamoyladenosine(37)-N6)-methyltransferase TrmO [Candidatus Aminicenantes bacterium]